VADSPSMATPVHPRLHARGTRDQLRPEGDLVRALIYAPSEIRASWIEGELASRSVVVQISHSVAHVVSALVEDPPPRPQLLVADFDALAPGELMHLHVLRERGWFGRIIALGGLPPSLRRSLAIDRVLTAPFVQGALREVVATEGFVAKTTRLPVL
jgi:hypothetical protein